MTDHHDKAIEAAVSCAVLDYLDPVLRCDGGGIELDVDGVRKVLRNAIAAYEANLWRPVSEHDGLHQRMLLNVPPYGVGSGHFNGRWHAHFVLNKDAEPDLCRPLPTAPKEGA